jgi:hypothetical protein
MQLNGAAKLRRPHGGLLEEYLVSSRFNPVIAECHLVLVSPLVTSNQPRRATAVVSRRFIGGPRLQTPAPCSLGHPYPTGDRYENRKIGCHSMYNPKEHDGSEI